MADKFINSDGLSYILNYFNNKKLFKIKTLETICENIELTDSNSLYSFPTSITLEQNALYYLSYQYYTSTGEYDNKNSAWLISMPVVNTDDNTLNVVWLTDGYSDGVYINEQSLNDLWRKEGCKSIITIKKIEIVINNENIYLSNEHLINLVFGNNLSSGINSHVEGFNNKALGYYSHAEGSNTVATGGYSHSEGSETESSGSYAHAEGDGSKAQGAYSHSEGYHTQALEAGSHAEGENTTASGVDSHSEGSGTETSGACSHAEGESSRAEKYCSHAEGYDTTASGSYSHSEGRTTTASGNASHVEGRTNTSSGENSHAEGYHTESSGICSHAEGNESIASGDYSHAGGQGTIASALGQTVIGLYNTEYSGTDVSSRNGEALFIVGKGTGEETRANALRVGENAVYGGTYNSSGADYAEYFEWSDKNLNNEDRIGRFVTLDGEKIRLANSTDNFILGVVSGYSSIIGDAYEDQWQGMYLYDTYGRPIYETVNIPDVVKEEDFIIKAHTEIRHKINPEYDVNQLYIPRSQRPEWSVVGMLGKLVVEDDGTCVVNGYCTSSNDGIATKSKYITKYRVIKRIDDSHIKILIL